MISRTTASKAEREVAKRICPTCDAGDPTSVIRFEDCVCKPAQPAVIAECWTCSYSGIAWARQAEDDAVQWLGVHGKHSPAAIEAYRAGFKAGWRSAISALVLHKIVKTYDRIFDTITGRYETPEMKG